jgi:hypothetical protein
MRTQRRLSGLGVSARLSPVPRSLSASCGTCVRYKADEARLDSMDKDVERVVRVTEHEGEYDLLFLNE